MNPFSRKNRGTALIWIGSLLFLVVIYDALRPFGERSLPARLGKKAGSLFSPAGPVPSAPAPGSGKVSDYFKLPPGARINIPCQGEALTDLVARPGPSYNLWIWAVKPKYRSGSTVRVEAAHAARGRPGGFSIVAFADTDDDGEPDKEIARSGYLAAQAPGTWSEFSFQAADERIFVGTTWPPGAKVLVYRQNGPWPGEDGPLEYLFYHRKGAGRFHTAGPVFTNMRVSFSD